MITLEQYFQAKPHAPQHETAAQDLITRRNRLRKEWSADTGKEPPLCPNTGTEISGSKNGQGDGGFRLQTATTGADHSSHKEARGVDDFDPGDELDTWLDRFEDGAGGNSKLEQYGLYREHPSATHGWCHLTTRAPGSGHRTFHP